MNVRVNGRAKGQGLGTRDTGLGNEGVGARCERGYGHRATGALPGWVWDRLGNGAVRVATVLSTKRKNPSRVNSMKDQSNHLSYPEAGSDARHVKPQVRNAPDAETESLTWSGVAAMALRFTALLVFLLGAALLFAADTATFRGNAAHTGVYDAAGSAQLNGVKWTFKAGGQLIASPAVDGDTLYVPSTGGKLYAVDRATGAKKWELDLKARLTSSPAVAEGVVYLTAWDGNFYAVDAAAGKVKWQFKTEGERRFSARHLHGMQPATETLIDPWDCWLSSPAVWNGAVYFGSGDHNIYALDAATGKLKWKFQTGDVVHASPAIDGGVVFIGSWDSNFYALDAATGKEKWRFKTGEDPDIHNQQGIQSSAAVADGMVFFGCRDAHMYALDEKTGAKKWAFDTKGSWVLTSPAVSKGKVFFGTSDTALLYAADAKTGAIEYAVGFNGWPVDSSPAIAGDMLYVGSTEGKLAAIHVPSGRMVWTFATEANKQNADGIKSYFAPFTTDFYDDVLAAYGKLQTLGPILASPVVVDKVVYVASVDGNLYALN
jgi:eukaryotic-like serine/threonine-protein kinase